MKMQCIYVSKLDPKHVKKRRICGKPVCWKHDTHLQRHNLFLFCCRHSKETRVQNTKIERLWLGFKRIAKHERMRAALETWKNELYKRGKGTFWEHLFGPPRPLSSSETEEPTSSSSSCHEKNEDDDHEFDSLDEHKRRALQLALTTFGLSAKDIDQKYRQMALLLHPDRNAHDTNEQMQKLNAARDILKSIVENKTVESNGLS